MDEESKVKLMTGTIKHLLDEITQLRAERDGLIALAEHEAKEVLRLKAELAAERELADRLADAVKCAIDDTVKGIAAIRCSTAGALSQALTAHATRRNKWT